MQNYYRDAAGRLRRRTEDGGGRPLSTVIIPPCNPAARYARRRQTTYWKGILAHLAETCSPDGANVITDVAACGHRPFV